ncbi:MAG TPA: GNAT family N-acetyltransferase [Blastocatellia bacterium]|nr:GNAT family N-acetyltransferase [Blastocatellia bacterium]
MTNSIARAVRTRLAPALTYDDATRLLRRFPRDIRLRDGSKLRMRQLCFDDREPLAAFFARCSPEAIRYRFLSPMTSISDSLLDYLADIDGSRHVALILTQREADEEMIVAEGRYVVFDERPAVADIAFLVADEMRRRGIATLLIDELISIACGNGVTHFSVDVLADNRAMLSLLRKTGLARSGTISSGVIHFETPILCSEAVKAKIAA